jgi:Outer membrane protein beta-barrel domain
MQAIDFWYKLNLYRAKVVVLVLLFSGPMVFGQTKSYATINRPDSDLKFLKYGFFLGFHQNTYNIKYSDAFDTPEYDDVISINAQKRPGFNLGFMLNFRLDDQVILRFIPVKIALYQYTVEYSMTDGTVDSQVIESTRLEPGIFFKYRSIRRGNSRMYVIGGITGSIRSRKSDEDPTAIRLAEKKFDLKAEIGFGADLYYKYFKFAPELRYSAGLINAIDGGSNFYTNGLQRISTHVFSLYFHFSD